MTRRILEEITSGKLSFLKFVGFTKPKGKYAFNFTAGPAFNPKTNENIQLLGEQLRIWSGEGGFLIAGKASGGAIVFEGDGFHVTHRPNESKPSQEPHHFNIVISKEDLDSHPGLKELAGLMKIKREEEKRRCKEARLGELDSLGRQITASWKPTQKE